ncbi:MAG: energy-coupling factor transporter ATPase [Firmicutes bacterium]|nr:energy-coupling factor transporter ATPase [Bacillota bacterium]
MPILVEKLSYRYMDGTSRAAPALHDLSLTVREGEFLGLIGQTGSGKSTLVQHLNGLLCAQSGSVRVDGFDMADKKQRAQGRKRVGLVFQYPEYQLFEETVEKDIAFGPKNLGLSEEEVTERVREALELVGLDYEKYADRSPFDLSGGQKRRVAIAGVIAMRPKVLILDEPTAGLDPMSKRSVLAMIQNLRHKEGMTILLVSHNMGDIGILADQVLVMEKGRLVMNGTPEEVFAKTDQLRSLRLGLPPATEFMDCLKKKGAAIDANPLTLWQAEDALCNWLEEGRKAASAGAEEGGRA